MKRFYCGLAVAVCLMLSGCGSVKVQVSPRADSASAGAETKISDSEAEQSSEDAVPEQEHFSSAGWRAAYAAVLRSSEAQLFSLVYIDDNDIPELVLHMSDAFVHANGEITLYTYMQGEAVNLGENLSFDGYSNFLYVPRKGYVVSGFFNMGYGAYQVFELKDGELTSLHTFDEDSNGEPICHVDGQNFPKERYDSIWNQYTEGNICDYGDFENNDTNIRKNFE